MIKWNIKSNSLIPVEFESIAGEFRKTGELKMKTGEFVNGVRWQWRLR